MTSSVAIFELFMEKEMIRDESLVLFTQISCCVDSSSLLCPSASRSVYFKHLILTIHSDITQNALSVLVNKGQDKVFLGVI